MLVSPEERILLLNSLPPAEGNAMFLRSVRRLRKELSFSDDEIREWKIITTAPRPGSTAFSLDTTLAKSVDIEIGPTAREYVAACLKNADAAGRLHEGLLGLFDSFFPEE